MLASLGNSVRETLPGQRILAAEVDVGVLGTGGEAGDRERLDQRERVVLDHDPVLERARLGLVRVANEVVRVHRIPGHRIPFTACRKRSAAAAEELRVGHLGDHAGRPQLERATQRVVAARVAIAVDARRVDVADPAKQPKVASRQRGDRLWSRAGERRRQRLPRSPSRSRCPSAPLRQPLRARREPAHTCRDRDSRARSYCRRRTAVPPGRRCCSSCSTSSALPRHMQAMSVQMCATRWRARLEREEGVEARDAVCLGGGNRQTAADVTEARLADPADPRLQLVQNRQQQVALAPRRVPATGRVTVGPACGADPRRARRAEHGVHSVTLCRGGLVCCQPEIHAGAS